MRKFLDLDALHEANIRDNPLPYLERASERIFQLQAALFEARQALSEHGTGAPSGETVTVDKDLHERLVSCAVIVEEAFGRLVSQADEE